MTPEQIRGTLLRVLGRIAPEVDPASIDPAADLREQMDLDSVDFLNFVRGVHQELGVEVPEADYPRLLTLDGCVAYLQARAATPATPA